MPGCKVVGSSNSRQGEGISSGDDGVVLTPTHEAAHVTAACVCYILLACT